VRASLARETTGALPPLRLPTPSPPHLSKLTPFLSFSRPAHSFFVPLSSRTVSLALLVLALFRSPLPFRNLDGARVPFLLSRLRFPRPPSFLYTTSFAVVGEGETPAFAVGEAVLFFPLIKADRCGSGCRDDGTGVGGGRCTGRVARGARRQRRWAEVVGRRWRRARHSMTCHVPTLPLTHPLARHDATIAVPCARSRYIPLVPPPPLEDACIWKIFLRSPSNKPTYTLHLWRSFLMKYLCRRISRTDVDSGDRAQLRARTYQILQLSNFRSITH